MSGVIILKTKQPRPAPLLNALRFLGSDETSSSIVSALRHDRPDQHGLPLWGPSDQGWTSIWEYMPMEQGGFFGGFPWMGNAGLFYWDLGNPNSYAGGLPFPPGNTSDSRPHVWEVAGFSLVGLDQTLNKNGNQVSVTYGRKYIVGMVVQKFVDGSKTGTLYFDLPNVDNDHVIQGPAVGNEAVSIAFGNTMPTNFCLNIGDSMWNFPPASHEYASCFLGRGKIIAKALSQSDMLAEASNFSSLVTSDGIANNWFSKSNWRNVDDVGDDFGSGKSLYWVDASSKASLSLQTSIAGWS